MIEFVPGAGKPGGCGLVFVTEVTNRFQGVAVTQEPPKASSPGGGKFKVRPEQTFPEDSSFPPWMGSLGQGEVSWSEKQMFLNFQTFPCKDKVWRILGVPSKRSCWSRFPLERIFWDLFFPHVETPDEDF